MQQLQLENVAIANALQLEGRPTSRQSLIIRFNYYDASAKFEVAQPIRARLIAF